MNNLLPFLTAALSLLEKGDEAQQRKNLRVVKRTYKQLKKEFSKDGLDDEEKEMLDKIKKAIVDKTLKLAV